MNLKYYLRGLGLGIVMTAIIMGITTHGKSESLTEKEIVEKAKELGMIEEEQLEEYLEKARAETEERVREEIARESAATVTAPVTEGGKAAGQEGIIGQDMSDKGNASAGQETPDAQDMAVREGEPEETREAEDEADREEALNRRETSEREENSAEEIIFTVKRGETPYSIGKRLEEEGLLPEDANFDRFMVDNGYDTKVVASEYRIPAGADMETIAKIITKQR